MVTRVLIAFALGLAVNVAAIAEVTPQQMNAIARERVEDLRLSTYFTATTVRKLAGEELSRVESLDVLRGLGITKVYIEVYRGGVELTEDELRRVKSFYESNGYPVVAGIATVPGGDFGVAADRGYTWFNWQAEKTQKDLRRVVRRTAGIFDEFIIDDFLCTADQSALSDAARGNRSWGEYRRDLLTELCQTVFIGPAREVNPDITMIIKFPQWYDRFHLFGYDVVRMAEQFDAVFVGTETRGATTPRFGYTQPYEGFVNYRWIDSIEERPVAGAWFDHGDCDGPDFLDQAWTTVLAGAREIVLFNYSNLAAGHPGHQLLRDDFEYLAELAATVRKHPVEGIPAYKPPNSDAGAEHYILDHLGMLGLRVVPVSDVDALRADYWGPIILTRQSAADKSVGALLKTEFKPKESGRSRTALLTAGFLEAMNDPELFAMAGVEPFSIGQTLVANEILDGDEPSSIEPPLRLSANIRPTGAKTLLTAFVDQEPKPFLLKYENILVLNAYTASQSDFDAVGELLLTPTNEGLLEIPTVWRGMIQVALDTNYFSTMVRSEPRMTYFIAGQNVVIQNHSQNEKSYELDISMAFAAPIMFDGEMDQTGAMGSPTFRKYYLDSPNGLRITPASGSSFKDLNGNESILLPFNYLRARNRVWLSDKALGRDH